MPSNRQVMILVDWENLIGCAQKVLGLSRCCPASILRVLAPEIEETTRRQYPELEITWRITAFAFPRSESRREPGETESIEKTAEEARRHNYKVLVVERRDNAADDAITELGLAVLYDRRIKACVLATQDSGTPFVSFLETVKRRTRIHLIGFDYIPESFGAENVFSFSLLRSAVAARMKRTCPVMSVAPSALPAAPAPALYTQTSVTPPSPEPISQVNLPQDQASSPTVRESALSFFRQPSSLTNVEHYQWIVRTLTHASRAMQDGWQGTRSQLFRSVKFHWQGPAPPDKVVQEILDVIQDRFFVRFYRLAYQPERMSAFLQKFPGVIS